ncbi:hypothetical protein Daesc_006862 [Daldinia eschscholtzii]|uniref:Uncharacterized protein n=1 Tax=Daldinia eschscholtzii TaxID=292717 RepID=A0AAX6MIT5_9PEZI
MWRFAVQGNSVIEGATFLTDFVSTHAIRSLRYLEIQVDLANYAKWMFVLYKVEPALSNLQYLDIRSTDDKTPV